MTILIKPEQMAESAKIGTDIRHKIHEEPELGLCLYKTQEKITKGLASFSLNEVYEYVGGKNQRCLGKSSQRENACLRP